MQKFLAILCLAGLLTGCGGGETQAQMEERLRQEYQGQIKTTAGIALAIGALVGIVIGVSSRRPKSNAQ